MSLELVRSVGRLTDLFQPGMQVSPVLHRGCKQSGNVPATIAKVAMMTVGRDQRLVAMTTRTDQAEFLAGRANVECFTDRSKMKRPQGQRS